MEVGLQAAIYLADSCMNNGWSTELLLEEADIVAAEEADIVAAEEADIIGGELCT